MYNQVRCLSSLYIKWISTVSARVQYTITSCIPSGVQHSIHVSSEHNQSQYIIIYYVREHQLPHAVDPSHTTPTTRVNRGPMLLKLIEGDIIRALGGSRTY